MSVEVQGDLSRSSFLVGESYATPSVCDHNCIFEFKVLRRTAKSVWVCPVRNGKLFEDEVVRRAVVMWGNVESIWPQGRYSMAPILRADEK